MTSQYHQIGFNWGNSVEERKTKAIRFYQDDKCTVFHSQLDRGRPLTVAKRKKGRATNECVAAPDLKTPFKSVQFVH